MSLNRLTDGRFIFHTATNTKYLLQALHLFGQFNLLVALPLLFLLGSLCSVEAKLYAEQPLNLTVKER